MVAAKRHLEPQSRDRHDHPELAESDQERRRGLAHDELESRDGADHQLFERAELALAHDPERRQRQYRDREQVTDRPGHEEPLAVELLVVPGTPIETYRGHALR